MFILRRFSKGTNNVEINQMLGESYTMTYRYNSYEKFRELFKLYFDKDHFADLDDTSDDDMKNVFAFISYNDGSKLQPLYRSQLIFIVCSDGKTFCRIKNH